MPQTPKAPEPPTTVAAALSQLAPATLAEALLAFQSDPPRVVMDKEAEVRSKDGKSKLYDYKYLSLQALLSGMRPRLTELGLVWRSKPGVDAEGKAVVEYRCQHVPTGESDEGVMPLVGAGGTMQGLGGAISFGRRYALITYFNLAPDVDEDASTATKEADAAKTKGQAAERKISKARAEGILAKAKAVNVLGRIQMVASKAMGADVGACDSLENSVKALRKLTGGQADKVEEWLDKKAQEAEDAPPPEPAGPGQGA